MKTKTDWIVMNGDKALCKRCGEQERIPTPMPIPAFLKWSDYFIAKHRHCQETK